MMIKYMTVEEHGVLVTWGDSMERSIDPISLAKCYLFLQK